MLVCFYGLLLGWLLSGLWDVISRSVSSEDPTSVPNLPLVPQQLQHPQALQDRPRGSGHMFQWGLAGIKFCCFCYLFVCCVSLCLALSVSLSLSLSRSDRGAVPRCGHSSFSERKTGHGRKETTIKPVGRFYVDLPMLFLGHRACGPSWDFNP